MTRTKEALAQEQPPEVFPKDISPIYPVVTDRLPKNPGNWVGQYEFNGARVFVMVKSDKVAVQNLDDPKLTDVSDHFPEINEAFTNLSINAAFDGQIIYGRGKTAGDHKVIDHRLKNIVEIPSVESKSVDTLRVTLVVNDFLYEDGFDLRKKYYLERYERLDRLLEPWFRRKYDITPNPIFEDLPSLVIAARKLGYNHVNLRRKNGQYAESKTPARSTWLMMEL